MIKALFLSFIIFSCSAFSGESKLRAVFDIRATATDSVTSYLNSGYGKFDNDDGQHLSLAQAGVSYSYAWQSGISAHLVANAYTNQGKNKAGFTEAFLKYRGLVNSSGFRWQNKLGIFYPQISIENDAIAWASKYTLTSSTINTWLGEEVRVLGNELSLTHLGRFNNQPYDLAISVTPFINNDPAGSLLSWHGWSLGNRQTLWTESRPLPSFIALRPGNALAGQAKQSDPFLEVDSRIGLHSKVSIKFHENGQFSAGFYDNNAAPYIVKHGQYAWHTRFFHFSGKWVLPYGMYLTGQYLFGDTLMQNPEKQNMVNNDYKSAYLSLTKRWKRHRLTSRIEEFSVTDNDTTLGDNNNEYGKALTLNYTYRLSKPVFLSAEYNWIDSDRPARSYLNQPQHLTERQWQLSARYFY